MHFESAIEAAVSVAAQIRYRRVPDVMLPNA